MKLNTTLATDRVGNSVNAYLWVGVQGVVVPEFIIRPNFLTSNSR
ncbi:hypothetical protein [Leptospira noguchii]|nr:hypothetical protein [Leptospira noguchii]